MSAIIQRHMVVKRETIGAQAAQPAISDSRSVLRKRRCQPVSRKVHGGKKGGEAKASSPTHYLLLNSPNLSGDNKGTGVFRFLPSSPLQILLAKPFSGTSLFRHEASANQPKYNHSYTGTRVLDLCAAQAMEPTHKRGCRLA